MNMMTQFNHNQKRMTSFEISELCQKRHDNVKRKIEMLVEQCVIQCPQIEDIKNHQNRNMEIYVFTGEQGKLDSITVVAQLCPEFTAALVKRWYELENQNTLQLPQTFAEALQLAADQARQLELAAPKVQYFDRVADTKNLLNASQVGKKVGMSAVRLNQYLADMGVYDRRIAGRTFAQWFIDKGYGEVKQTEQGYPQSKFTNKGEQWVIEQLVSEGVVQ